MALKRSQYRLRTVLNYLYMGMEGMKQMNFVSGCVWRMYSNGGMLRCGTSEPKKYSKQQEAKKTRYEKQDKAAMVYIENNWTWFIDIRSIVI